VPRRAALVRTSHDRHQSSAPLRGTFATKNSLYVDLGAIQAGFGQIGLNDSLIDGFTRASDIGGERRAGGILLYMAPRDQLRAADSDREKLAERLRQALEEGRLDLNEYDDRLGQAYAAKTYGELDRLVTDLPAPPPAKQVYPGAARRWLAEQWRPWVNVVSICVAIWLLATIASAGLVYFWPFWVAVPWGVVLLVRTAGGLSRGEPQQWAANRVRGGSPKPKGPTATSQ